MLPEWISKARDVLGNDGRPHDPALPPSANAMRLRTWMARDARHWSDGLPGARDRRWRRLCQRFLAFGDPRAAAALAAYAGATLDDFNDLRLIAHLVAQFGDMARYEALITGFDPALMLSDAPQKAFVGAGGGLGALNVFRKLDTGDASRFEKIYAQARPALARSTFALETVLARHPVIDTPALRIRRDGKRLTALEFDFVDFRPLERGRPELAAPVVRRLAEIDAAPFGVVHKRFVQSYTFERGQRMIHARLRARDPVRAAAHATAYAGWMAQILRYPLVFSHGDLNFTNISADGLVLDWDSAGFRQYGYDAAYSCRRRPFEDLDELLAFCRAHYERPGSAHRDRFAFAFFFLSMMPDTGVHWKNLPLFNALLARMPKLAAAADTSHG